MYSIFESVINKGGYKLGEMLNRIKTYAAEGKVTLSEMETLERMARDKANAQDGVDIFKKVEELEQRIRVLEAHHVTVEDEPPVDENGDTIIAEYVPGKWYYAGDVAKFNGEVYACVAPEGVVCVWNPDEYPVYWEKVE